MGLSRLALRLAQRLLLATLGRWFRKPLNCEDTLSIR